MSVSTTRSAFTNASAYSGDMTAMRLNRFGWNTATSRFHLSPLPSAADITAEISEGRWA